MIKQFNFYDVYGYAIPGLTFLSLVWLPYGLATGKGVPFNLASALLAVVLGYVAGHLIQILTRFAFRSEVSHKGLKRHPSSILLDADDKNFSQEFKQCILAEIRTRFSLQIGDADSSMKANSKVAPSR